MLINFIGSFNSGKTTTASKVFSVLKENGTPCEYLPEQARIFIANRRVNELKLEPNSHITLSDQDQLEILKKQLDLEILMYRSCGDKVILVSDSSIYNSLLYMSNNFRFSNPVMDICHKAEDFYETLNTRTYICKQIATLGLDPNRIHSEKDQNAINNRLSDLYGNYNIPELSGSVSDRANKVLSDLYDF